MREYNQRPEVKERRRQLQKEYHKRIKECARKYMDMMKEDNTNG